MLLSNSKLILIVSCEKMMWGARYLYDFVVSKKTWIFIEKNCKKNIISFPNVSFNQIYFVKPKICLFFQVYFHPFFHIIQNTSWSFFFYISIYSKICDRKFSAPETLGKQVTPDLYHYIHMQHKISRLTPRLRCSYAKKQRKILSRTYS